MAVALGTVNTTTTPSQTTTTIPFTSTNQPLYVAVHPGASVTVSSVTFAGVALAPVASVGGHLSLYRLANPSAVADNIVVTLSSAAQAFIAYFNTTGQNTTYPDDAGVVTNVSGVTSMSLSPIGAQAGDLVLALVDQGSGMSNAITPGNTGGTTLTELYDTQIGTTTITAEAFTVTDACTGVTASWTGSSSGSMLAVRLIASGHYPVGPAPSQIIGSELGPGGSGSNMVVPEAFGVTGSGALSVATSAARSGSYGLHIAATGGSANYASYKQRVSGGALVGAYQSVRFYLRVNSATTGNPNGVVGAFTSAPALTWAIMVSASGGGYSIQLLDALGSFGTGTSITADVWHLVEVDASTVATDVYLDGTLIAHDTGQVGAANVELRVGCGITGTPTGTFSVDIDDIVAYAGSLIAPLQSAYQVGLLLPTSDNIAGNASTGWTGGGGSTANLYQGVDNVPPAGLASSWTSLSEIKTSTSKTAPVSYAANADFYYAAGVGNSDGTLSSSDATGGEVVVIWGGNTSALGVGQQFSLGRAATSVTFAWLIAKNNSPTDNVIFEIRNDNAGLPGSTVLGSSTVAASGLAAGTPAWQSVTVSASLSAGTKYWACIRRSGSADTTNNFNVVGNNSNHNGIRYAIVNSTGTWSLNTADGALAFYVTAGVADTVLAVQAFANHAEEISTGTKTGVLYTTSNPSQSAPAAASVGSFDFGDDSGAITAFTAATSTWRTGWGAVADVRSSAPTLSSAVAVRIDKTDTTGRIGHADFLAVYVLYQFPAATSNTRDTVARFRLAAQGFRDTLARFRLLANKTNDTLARFRLQGTGTRDTGARFRLVSPATWRDLAARVRLAAALARDTRARLALRAQAYRDTRARFGLVTPAAYRDTAGRSRFAGARILDTSSRFRLAGLVYRFTAARYRLLAQAWRVTSARFRLVSPPVARDTASRFRLLAQAYRFTSARLRLVSPVVYRLTAARFGLVSGATRDTATRLRLLASATRDTATRLGLGTPASYRHTALRDRLAVLLVRDSAARYRLGRAAPLRDTATRLLLAGLGYRDSEIRFLLQPGQSIRPDADSSIGGWTTDTGATTGLYGRINEATPDTTTYIQSSAGPTNDADTEALPPFTDPGSALDGGGYRIGIVYGREPGTATGSITVEILASGVSVATRTYSNVPAGWTRDDVVLTASEVAAFRANNGFASPAVRFTANQTA